MLLPNPPAVAVRAGPAAAPDPRSAAPGRGGRGRIPVGGMVGAVLALAASLAPSLYARPPLTQGVVTGVAVALGYGLGCAGGALVRPAAARLRAGLPGLLGRAMLALLLAAVPLLSFASNHRWQADSRRLMGMEGIGVGYHLVVAAVALGLACTLVLAARGVRALLRVYIDLLCRLRRPVTRVVVTLLLLGFTADVLIAGQLMSAFHGVLAANNGRFDEGGEPLVAPTSGYRSGGPGSLVSWEALGRKGRRFVSAGPQAAELSAFSGQPARHPIRVYAGFMAADSDAARAQLAVAELERTGAFDRSVLVVITPTGTGLVNADAIDTLEYLHNGDTAAVAVQYGYDPSWATMIADRHRATRGAQALFTAVSDRLAQEPPASRPKLLVYGESLGSFGSEGVFADLDDVTARTDGALWVGPPRANDLWRHLTETRDAGTPIWAPVHADGRQVRFGWDGASLAAAGPGWDTPRVVYLQHASDPITWWTPELAFSRPEWLRDPRGPDISERMRYLPVVTFAQVSIDLMLGARAPMGHGHMFGPAQAEAWSLIAPPDGWSDADTARLLEVMR